MPAEASPATPAVETSPQVTPGADAASRVKVPRAPSPKMVTATAAGFMCGQSRTSWDRLTALGKNPEPVTLGGRKFWRVDEVKAWILAGCPVRAEWAPRWRAIVAEKLKAKRTRR